MSFLSLDTINSRALSFGKQVIEEIENQGRDRKFKYRCLNCFKDLIQKRRYLFSNTCSGCAEMKKIRIGESRARVRAKDCDLTFLGFAGYRSEHYYWLVECNKCGNQKESQINHFANCEPCAILRSRSNTEEFIAKSTLIHDDKYDYKYVNYITSRIKVDILCKKCGYVFSQRPTEHLNGNGCPRCNESKGEKIMIKYFESRNIKYVPQKKFPGLVDKKALKYDFYCILNNKELLFEYNGIQHYELAFTKDLEKARKNLEGVQRRDKIKYNYALDHNIALLVIAYWDFDYIFDLMDKFFLEQTNIDFKI